MVAAGSFWSYTHTAGRRRDEYRWAMVSLDTRARHAPYSRCPCAQNDFPEIGCRLRVFASTCPLPFVCKRNSLGNWKRVALEVHPFTPAQIKLLETFADQAVIAIENVRLFQELKESLEQQTATSEILGVIASSPTDIQPVLDAVAENAARLCDAIDAQIIRVEGDFVRAAASYGSMPGRSRDELTPITLTQAPTRAIIDRQTIHVHDMAAEVETNFLKASLHSNASVLELFFARLCCARACRSERS